MIFSGDKLLGGPQAGIITGRADLVEACGRHPLYRAVRPGALVLGALQQVALSYLRGDAARLPLWAMPGATVADLKDRAECIRVDHALPADLRATDLVAVVGGGSAPGVEIPSWGFELPGDQVATLRRTDPLAVIARVRDGRTTIDLRTVAPEHDAALGRALADLAHR